MLEKLSVSLIKPQIQARITKLESLNFKHLQFEIVKSFLHLGFEINRKASNNSISLKRCQFCNYRPNMKKEKRKCEVCEKHFCLNHGRDLYKCFSCIDDS